MSRFLYLYVGILGFDKVYINVMYNASVHLTPPTLQELYPTNTSCMSEWAELGVIDWFTLKFAGYRREEWDIDPDTNQKSLRVDLYRLTRGLNPRFNGKLFLFAYVNIFIK